VRIDFSERIINLVLCGGTVFILVFGPLMIFSDRSPLVEPNPVISGLARVNFVLNKTVMILNDPKTGRTTKSENITDFRNANITAGDQLIDVHVPFNMFENHNLVYRTLTAQAWNSKKNKYRVTETT
jgi:hypothetical protein